MQKIKFLAFSLILLVIVIGCNKEHSKETSKVETKGVNNQPRDYFYKRDSAIFANYKNHKNTFDSTKAEIYFVSKWNTPDYFVSNIIDNGWTGIYWDGNAFLGYEKNDSVYFLSKYHAYSDEYLKEKNNSTIIIEKKFSKKGVTKDPRKTCMWLSEISKIIDEKENKDFSLNNFLKEATAIDEDTYLFKIFLSNLKKDILKCSGSTQKEKLINYTAAAVSGKPEEWDAWDWPGYY